MRSWIVRAGTPTLDALTLVERDEPRPGPGEVLVRVRACSLNYRDRMIVAGKYMGGPAPEDIVPLSDGAGEVAEVGEGVTAFKPGDRVQSLFFQNWHDGAPRPDAGPALGAYPADGMLSEYVVLPERGVTRMAGSLSFEEAATLPCAGVTAWNALMEGRKAARPGAQVLVLGTGGVSVLALQIARVAGAQVFATSGSDEKAARIRELGASDTVNYRTTTDWGAEIAKLSGRGGVDHVVEVGGTGTLAQSMQAVGYDGEIGLIGVLTQGSDANPSALMFKGASVRGIFVGSKAMADRLNAAVDANGIKPVIGARFGFDDAVAAFRHQESPDLFGKIVIGF